MAGRKDVTVIIRSAGERTVSLIRNLLEQQVSGEQIFEVKEVPLSNALRVSYEIAIKDNKKWILIIDGDVLPFKNMLDRLITIFDGIDDRIFTLQCNVLDKMTQSFRRAGIHMHRTSFLKKALGQIPEPNETIRPESVTINRMAAKGYSSLFIDEVLALHDYEQYYADLFRKGFFSAHKHTKNLIYFKKMWPQLATNDNDYELLLEGLKEGEKYDGLVVSNVRIFDKFDINSMLSSKGMAEKGELDSEKVNFSWINGIYKKFEIPTEYYNAQLFSGKNQEKISYRRRFIQLKAQLGVWKMGPWLIGNYLEKGGRGLKDKLEG